FGSSRGQSVNMNGLGAGVRYRPAPHFALDVGLDFLSGRDWHDHLRREGSLSVTAQVYFNPESTFQVYLPLGMHSSRAWVSQETPDGNATSKYQYFGAHAGIGGEIRLSPK